MTAIDQAVATLLAGSGLEPEQAKLVTYWSAGTWKLATLPNYSILRFCGPPGTGKSTAMEVMRPWCNKPKPFSGKRITPAALRDELVAAKLGTAIIEEADETANAKECEALLAARFSPATAKLAMKENREEKKWRQRSVSIYGATVVHYRRAYADLAVASRTITIETRIRDGNYREPQAVSGLAAKFKSLADIIDLDNVADFGSGRVYDTWRPVLAVAKLAKDERWLAWAKERIGAEVDDLRDGHAYEVVGLMLARMVESLTNGDQIRCRELKIQDDIVVPLRNKERIYITPWQANRQLTELGFHTYRSGGVNKVMPTPESLLRAANKIGYKDQLLSKGIQGMQNMQIKNI